jgi:RNA polymerase sigma factor (sigma-70 family)
MPFPTTVWSRILSKDRFADHVSRRYAEPVFRFLLSRPGMNVEQARDLTQEVFLQLLKPDFLAKVDPKKGRFRNLILRVTSRVWAMWVRGQMADKRREERPALVLDEAVVDEVVAESASPVDRLFAQFWLDVLFRHAMERLEREDARRHAVLRAVYLQGRSQADVAAELGLTETQVRLDTDRGKKALEGFIEEELREYCSSDEEYEAEIAELKAWLG